MLITAPIFDDEELELVSECLKSGWVTQGELTIRLETLIANYHQVRHAIATTSCTAALHLASLALNLGPGDEVIVPAFTWITSANAAEYVGAKAVFVDVEINSYNIDPVAIEAAITPNTRAIIVVHLFGLAANMDIINNIAKKYSLAVVEDAACAVATTYKGMPVGSIGDIGCFSFHPRKLITTGEGGMVTTNNDDLAMRVRSLRNHGSTGVPSAAEAGPAGPWTMATFDMLGYNLRLSDIQAAIGVAQFAKLDKILKERREAAYRYSELLGCVDEIFIPTRGIDVSGHTFQSYVIRINKNRELRNTVMLALAAQDIQTRPGTHAVHRLGFYRNKYNFHSEDFPVAAMCEDQSITLPIFPGITIDDQKKVVQIIKQVIFNNN